MNENDRATERLERIGANQRQALEAQQQLHLQIAQARADRTSRSVEERIELQGAAASRLAQASRTVIPPVPVLPRPVSYPLINRHMLQHRERGST